MNQKFVRSDRDPLRQRCPQCHDGQLTFHKNSITCRRCAHVFTPGEAVTDIQLREQKRKTATAAGSGVIAGRPYRTGYRWGRLGAGW